MLPKWNGFLNTRAAEWSFKGQAKLAPCFLPARIHTTCVSCCPLETLLKCQFLPTTAWHTNKIQKARKRTESTYKHFSMTPISWRMHPNFELNVQLTSYRDTLITASLRGSDPIRLNIKRHTDFRKCKPEPWAGILTVTVTHIISGQSHFLCPHLQLGHNVLHHPSPKIN